MARKLPTEFDAWELSTEEELQACVFTELQLMYIKTELCVLVQEKLAIKFDPTLPDSFNKEHTFYDGQITVLKMLLAKHQDTISKLETYAREMAFRRAAEEAPQAFDTTDVLRPQANDPGPQNPSPTE